MDCICLLVVYYTYFYMNEYARPKQIPQVAIKYCTDNMITQYPSSRQKSYSNHLHVKYTKVFKFYRMNWARDQQF